MDTYLWTPSYGHLVMVT